MASGEEEIEGELHEPDEIDWFASKGELSTLEINVAGVYCQHKLLCMGMRYGEATFFLYQAEGKNYSFGLWQDVEQAILKWTELESFIMEEEDRLILFHASHFLELLRRISRIPLTVPFKRQLSLSGLPGDVQASFVMDSASIILMTQRMEEMEKRAAQSAASASFYLQTSHLQAVQQARLLEQALFTATVSPTSTPVIISTPTPPVGVSTSPVVVSTSPVVVSTPPVVVSTSPVVVSTPPVVVTDPPKPPVVDLTSVQARKAQFEALATAAAAVRQAGPIGGPSRRLPVGAVPAVGGAPGTAAGGVAAGFGRAPIQRPAGAAAAPSPVAAPKPSTGAARGTGPVSWRPAGGLAAPPGSGVEDSICLTKFELPALEKGVGSFRYSREELTYLRSLLNMSTPSGFTTRKWREFVSLRPGVRHVCWEDFDALVPLFRSGPLISSLTNAVSFSRQFEDLTLTGNPSHGPELRAIVEQLKGAIFEVLEHVPARTLSTNLIVLRQITRDSITREHISQWTLKQLIAVYDISICVLYSVLCQAFHLSLARR